MTTAVVVGTAVLVSGWIASLGLTVRRNEQLRARLLVPSAAPRSPGRIFAAVSELASRRGWPGSPIGYLGGWLGAAVAAAGLGARLVGPVGFVLGVIGGPVGLEGWLSRRRQARVAAAELQLRDFALALAAAVRAGLSIRLGLAEAALDLEEPLGPVVTAVLRDLEAGRPLDDAMDRIASDLDLPDARLLVTALAVHRRTGGQLPDLLDELAEVVGQRVEARRGARVLLAQGRASGAVLAVLPVAFVALLSGTGGDGLGAFYRTPLGAGLLVGGVLLDAAGFVWIRRIVARVERPR